MKRPIATKQNIPMYIRCHIINSITLQTFNALSNTCLIDDITDQLLKSTFWRKERILYLINFTFKLPRGVIEKGTFN